MDHVLTPRALMQIFDVLCNHGQLGYMPDEFSDCTMRVVRLGEVFLPPAPFVTAPTDRGLSDRSGRLRVGQERPLQQSRQRLPKGSD